ncbi:MAG: HlyC/CorC family transporter [Myxococcales bacterium]|nr:HlyC/CorC family transporter [Myxococcales bacterium]
MLLELLVILVLVLVNGLFAGAEIAVVGFERARLAPLVEAGGRRARAVQALRDDPERFFATVQIVITVVGATAGAFGGATFARDLAPVLAPWLGAYAGEVALALVVVVVSFSSLVLGELVPKSLALRQREPYALFAAPALLWLSRAVRPLVWLLTKASNLVLRAFDDSTTFSEARLSPEELRTLVEEAADSGTLDPRVGEIATRALDFAKLTASHVMIPRTRVVGIERRAHADEIRRVVLEHAHSRLPVYHGDLDAIVGYVLYKDLLPLAWEGRLLVLEDLIRPAIVASEAMEASQVLHEMRAQHTHLAVVVDPEGGTAGIVTFDDLVEELVGDVFGELHSAPADSMRPEADGSILVRAEVPIRDVNRAHDLTLPEGDGFSTVGGLCLRRAGRVPQAGDRLALDDGTLLVIEEASERAVVRVRLVPKG